MGEGPPYTRAVASPLMEQYSQIKAKHADEILLFRLGDFYEMFHEDAKTAMLSRSGGEITAAKTMFARIACFLQDR